MDAKAEAITLIIDHIVAALGGEPSCTLRRANILIDIDEHPGTTQSEIMERHDLNKSALNRDIEWLYDYGCILRTPNKEDNRTINLSTCGYAKKNIDLALSYFDYNHKNLQNFLNSLINIFGSHKPTLRDVKIIAVLGHKGPATRQAILESLYNGPTTTDNRAVNNLINFGLLQKQSD
ncbi:MAG TPA: MarR family transcriptional regulator [Micavibrio sp.]|nr:MarR family transcriptional regulator [Micavibrio sp.]